MIELQNIKTAIHEIAHATLHDTGIDDPERFDRRTREVQAESVAYTVCQHYGLDTSDYSFGYVAGWSSGRELAELMNTEDRKRCTKCDTFFTSTSNNVKYCLDCRKRITRRQAAERMRKRRTLVTR